MQPSVLSISHFSIFASFDSLYRSSIFVLYINQIDLQTEETGLLSNWFYCFQSATAYSCFICFQIIYGISGGWADWNISKFPKEDCVAGKGTSVNFLKRICVLILYILKLLFWSKNSVCFEPLHCFQTVVGLCSWCFKIAVPTDFHLVLLCKESDFETETEIISPCFQSVTIYSRTSVARTLMARLP